ncbi:putative aminoacyltransferase, E1 ubiquitin-activating enzyme [Rosa chinensis]|uniref:Putative aminoacyltransferase, E1 ubiquitin-activating enzyme n=1 Tax=Rosa chinensis TaxID=74649 RepID=A0A2P6SQT2_ROSCH|nr:putative aminoacyltransferase, E1 ubiquitin-activating enzyme [Rosa chinensis]
MYEIKITGGQQIVFRTLVFHCNVDSSGNVSLEIVKDGWSPAPTITKVLLVIRSIFTKPDPLPASA